jgi:hypothetical protein
VTARAHREAEARDVAEPLGRGDGLEDGLGAQPLDVGHEAGLIARRLDAVPAGHGQDPAVALEREHQPAAPVAAGEREHALPVARCAGGDLEDGGRVGQIDADRGLDGCRLSKGLQQAQRQRPAPGCVHDHVGVDGLQRPVGVLVADAGDAPRTGHQVLRTAARADVDRAVRLRAASHGELDQRPRHRIGANAEIALREGRERGRLRTDVEPDADRHGAGAREVVLEAGEQLAQRPQPAREQHMDMLALRHPRAVLGLVAEDVGLQHHHALEVDGQRLRGREPAHPCADDDGLLANHHFPPRSIRTLP